MFKPISDKVSLPDLEKEILAHWKQYRIFQKRIEARQNAPDYTFYEGPPTANGKPGIHHVFARTINELVCRYLTTRCHSDIRTFKIPPCTSKPKSKAKRIRTSWS